MPDPAMLLAAILRTALRRSRPAPGEDQEWPDANEYYDRVIAVLDTDRGRELLARLHRLAEDEE